MSNAYRVIFPGGDQSKLATAFVMEYEIDDWAIASRKIFDDVDECKAYMVQLANKHGLVCEGAPAEGNYLD